MPGCGIWFSCEPFHRPDSRSYQSYWALSHSCWHVALSLSRWRSIGEIILNLLSSLYISLTGNRLKIGRWASLSTQSRFHLGGAAIIWVDGSASKFYHHLKISTLLTRDLISLLVSKFFPSFSQMYSHQIRTRNGEARVDWEVLQL